MVAGNITSKATYVYTVGTLPAQAVETSTYYYAAEWEDRLNRIVTTTAGGTQTQYIKYDPIGNPYVYDSFSLEWRGKQLTGITGEDGLQVAYSYNADGLRTQKVVGQTTYTYLWANGRLCRVTASVATDNGVSVSYADFIYDTNGTVSAMRYVSGNTDTLYYFVTTYAGDVAAIYSESGDMLAEFCYDAWGNFTYANAPTPGSPLDLSTFRYRGYIYDNETDWYYLRTRYYAPDQCRFISADKYITTGEQTVNFNMYAYANDNPVIYVDENGEFVFLLGILLFVAEVALITTAVVVEVSNHSNEEMIDENYAHNVAYEEELREKYGEDYCGYLEDQGMERGIVGGYQYGKFNADFNACEAIAIHNALYKIYYVESDTKTYYSLSTVIYNLQSNNSMVMWGIFGTNIFSIDENIRQYGLKCTSFSPFEKNLLYQEGNYIVSYFNPDLSIHTIFIETKEDSEPKRFILHNYQSRSAQELETIPDNVWNPFIIGYRIWKSEV